LLLVEARQQLHTTVTSLPSWVRDQRIHQLGINAGTVHRLLDGDTLGSMEACWIKSMIGLND